MIIGIDPGQKGAIAFLSSKEGHLLSVRDMPVISVKVGGSMRDRLCPHQVRKLLENQTPEMVIIEKVQGITGQSASAAFTFGYQAGELMGVVVGLGFPVCLITPQQWKKAAGMNKDKGTARM